MNIWYFKDISDVTDFLFLFGENWKLHTEISSFLSNSNHVFQVETPKVDKPSYSQKFIKFWAYKVCKDSSKKCNLSNIFTRASLWTFWHFWAEARQATCTCKTSNEVRSTCHSLKVDVSTESGFLSQYI